MVKENLIGKRLVEAFGTDDKAFIAQKLGFSSVQAVYKVINGERELDFEKLQNFRNYTKRSIDWLLTGKPDETHIMESRGPVVEDALVRRIREIVQEELYSPANVQQLGTIDEFDIEAALRVNDDPRQVMRLWFESDNIPVPEEFVSSWSMEDWKSLSIKDKVKQIRGMRSIYEGAEHRRKHIYASTKSKDS